MYPIFFMNKQIALLTKTIFLYLFFLVVFNSESYSQLVINNGAIINLYNGSAGTPIYFTLNNPPVNPISVTGASTSGIMMESEYNITKYNLGTSLTSVTIPYISSNSEYFPLTFTPTSNGVGAGSILFSSTKAASRITGWDNFVYKPSEVTNMKGHGAADNSAYVLDRFWIIDQINYSTSPAATIGFSYINAEGAANGSNVISLSNMQAQAFDRVSNTWGNYTPAGSNITGGSVGTVNNVNIGAGLIGNVYRSWTLADQASPLPVTLLSFNSTCTQNNMILYWTTTSEQNSSYFNIEKSTDGFFYTQVASITAKGNNTGINNYSFTDTSYKAGIVYYKLSETNVNNVTGSTELITADCNLSKEELVSVFSSAENLHIIFNSTVNQSVNIAARDACGKLVYKNTVTASAGNNEFQMTPSLASGIYLLEVTSNTRGYTKKIILTL